MDCPTLSLRVEAPMTAIERGEKTASRPERLAFTSTSCLHMPLGRAKRSLLDKLFLKNYGKRKERMRSAYPIVFGRTTMWPTMVGR